MIKKTEKLLGLNISSNLDWDTHVDMLCISLKQRMGLIARAKDKVTKHKLRIISEAIFMSKVRYGLAVYTKPKYEFNHLINNIALYKILKRHSMNDIH